MRLNQAHRWDPYGPLVWDPWWLLVWLCVFLVQTVYFGGLSVFVSRSGLIKLAELSGGGSGVPGVDAWWGTMEIPRAHSTEAPICDPDSALHLGCCACMWFIRDRHWVQPVPAVLHSFLFPKPELLKGLYPNAFPSYSVMSWTGGNGSLTPWFSYKCILKGGESCPRMPGSHHVTFILWCEFVLSGWLSQAPFQRCPLEQKSLRIPPTSQRTVGRKKQPGTGLWGPGGWEPWPPPWWVPDVPCSGYSLKRCPGPSMEDWDGRAGPQQILFEATEGNQWIGSVDRVPISAPPPLTTLGCSNHRFLLAKI